MIYFLQYYYVCFKKLLSYPSWTHSSLITEPVGAWTKFWDDRIWCYEIFTPDWLCNQQVVIKLIAAGGLCCVSSFGSEKTSASQPDSRGYISVTWLLHQTLTAVGSNLISLSMTGQNCKSSYNPQSNYSFYDDLKMSCSSAIKRVIWHYRFRFCSPKWMGFVFQVPSHKEWAPGQKREKRSSWCVSMCDTASWPD